MENRPKIRTVRNKGIYKNETGQTLKTTATKLLKGNTSNKSSEKTIQTEHIL